MNRAFLRRQARSQWKDLGSGCWERWDYKCCYLTIRQLDNGKFKPMIGAMGDLTMPGVELPPEGYHQLNTLEDAKKFLHEYVDYIRNVWDKKAKEDLIKLLHNMRPDVFPL